LIVGEVVDPVQEDLDLIPVFVTVVVVVVVVDDGDGGIDQGEFSVKHESTGQRKRKGKRMTHR
jgi:hypothetical protein